MPKQHQSKAIKNVFAELRRIGFIVEQRKSGSYRIIPPSTIAGPRNNSISANITRQEQQVIKVLNKAFSQAPDNLQPLKRKSFALLYKYLACRILEQAPSRLNGWKGLRLIGIYTWYEPQLWEQLKLIFIILFKSIALIVLPQSPKLLQKFKLTTP